MEDTSVLAIPMPTGTDDRAQAESLARRYCAEFVDLAQGRAKAGEPIVGVLTDEPHAPGQRLRP